MTVAAPVWFAVSLVPLALIYVVYGGWRRLSPVRRVAWCVMVAMAVLSNILPLPWSSVATLIGVMALVAFLRDDWWNGLRRRVKARLPRRRLLAWGVPARRPQPA